MFHHLSNNITKVFKKLRGQTHLRESTVNEALREIRIALLEADVALPVVRRFIEQVKADAIGKEIINHINPTQMMIKIVHDHLVQMLDTGEQSLQIKNSPSYFMMVGLQGSGKTTTSAKIGFFIQEHLKKKVLLASVDIYRPAAQKQLDVLGHQHNILTLPINEGEDVKSILKRTKSFASSHVVDVVIIDTAGRLHIDDALMQELKDIQKSTNPCEIILTADAMTGQDSIRIATAFKQTLPITGLVLTRCDGDGRAGAALSMGYASDAPIKFLGVGEKIHQLEIFNAKRLADRILDQGDVVVLVENAQAMMQHLDHATIEKNFKNNQFDFNDLKKQLEGMLKMGNFSQMLSFLPGLGAMKDKINDTDVQKKIKQQIAVICSMTPKERTFPEILNGMRRRRIAKGAGVSIAFVNQCVKQYEATRQMMKDAKKKRGLFSKMKLPFG